VKNAERIELAIRAFAWVMVPDNCISVEGYMSDGGVANTVLPHNLSWATDEVTKAVVTRLCPHVTQINSEYEAKSFIAYVVVYHGIGAEYSPSKGFDEYTDDEGLQLLDQDTGETLDTLQSMMFASLGQSRPWELAHQLLYELFGPAF
jgi:hypothetical protein